jgi:hypothetical protein
MVRRWKDAMV